MLHKKERNFQYINFSKIVICDQKLENMHRVTIQTTHDYTITITYKAQMSCG